MLYSALAYRNGNVCAFIIAGCRYLITVHHCVRFHIITHIISYNQLPSELVTTIKHYDLMRHLNILRLFGEKGKSSFCCCRRQSSGSRSVAILLLPPPQERVPRTTGHLQRPPPQHVWVQWPSRWTEEAPPHRHHRHRHHLLLRGTAGNQGDIGPPSRAANPVILGTRCRNRR